MIRYYIDTVGVVHATEDHVARSPIMYCEGDYVRYSPHELREHVALVTCLWCATWRRASEEP